MLKNKIVTTAIALILMLTIIIPIIASESTIAQVSYVSTGKFQTQAFIGAKPNPVGVGQEVLLHVGIQQALSTARLGWEGLTVTVTKPDNTTETLGPVRTDSTGATGIVYVPNMVGIYYLQTHFPEQRMPTTAGGIPANTTMLASSSPILTLDVKEEPRQFYPGSPLPTEFWTRPINAQHREWYTISGSNWMDNSYNEAPESPHILWTKPLTMGGLVGGDIGEQSFEHGDAYQGKWSSRFIIAGILIYTHHTSIRPLEYTAVDIRTGELLWKNTFLDNRSIATAQTFYWSSYNYHGTYSYLWVTIGTTWYGFDPMDCTLRLTLDNIPSGTNVIGERGDIYRYSISTAQGRMTLWNMSALISVEGSFRGPGPGTYNASATTSAGALTTAAQRAYALNFTFPTGLPGSVRGVNLGDKVVGSRTTSSEINLWAFSLKPGQEGQLLYNTTWKAPASWAQNNVTFATYGSSWATTDMEANIGLIWAKEELTHYAFDLTNGQYMWKTEIPQHYLDTYSIGRRIDNNKMYSVGQAGKVYCWDIANGRLLWIYNATDTFNEFLWGNDWSLDILFIEGGKIYLFHSEHSPINPLFRDAPTICLDGEIGEEVWRVNGLFRKTDWGGGPIMGDSVIAMYNSYDQRIYAIGKGPSATTVNALPKSSIHGSSIIIEGTVADISPGTKEYSVISRFPHGVPAVSDNSQGEWMKYVYAQFARPIATGVEVTISVIDSNGNYRDIGKTTSSSDGFYSLIWTPDITGEFKVYASFDGSKSYYPSHAETVFVVDQAPEPTPDPTPPPASVADMYFVPAIAGLFAAIAIVGALLALLLLKKRL
jgi:hypothetical protein